MPPIAQTAGPATPGKDDITLSIKLLFVGILLLKVLLCFFMGHFDIYRFLVFLQHAISFPDADPWAYRADNINSDFPYPPALYYLLKGLVSLGPVNAIPPHEPAGMLYSLIKSPIFLADLVVALVIGRRTSFRWMVCTYWTSSIIVFHQYYSGQFDLFVAAPFVLGLYLSELAQSTRQCSASTSSAIRWPFYVGLLVSTVLKPFALLLTPATLVTQARDRKTLLRAVLALILIFLIFKASEWPYSQSAEYRAQMGSGAKLLLMNIKMHRKLFFPVAFIGILAWAWFKKIDHQWLLYSCIILAIGAFSFHSAGWMTWAAVCLPVVLHDLGRKPLHFALLQIWHLAFVLRWAYCPTSPMFDSLSVFTDRFLNLGWKLPMGYLYQHQSTLFGMDIFLFFGYAFGVSSLLLMLALLKDSRHLKVN